MKYFSNERCLKEHIQSCHQYVVCDECGTKHLKKNIKRHMRSHEGGLSSGRINCGVKGCSLTFSTVSLVQYKLSLTFGLWIPQLSVILLLEFFLIQHIYLFQTSNLNQHIKAVHWELKPFVCGLPGCNKRFTYKHVRDNHEKSGCHIYTPVSFSTSRNQSLTSLVSKCHSICYII